MKYLGAVAWLGAVLATASGAWAQFGLSGAPELVPLFPQTSRLPAAYPASEQPDIGLPADQRPAPLSVPRKTRPIKPTASYAPTGSASRSPYEPGYSYRPLSGEAVGAEWPAAAAGSEAPATPVWTQDPPVGRSGGFGRAQAEPAGLIGQMLDESGCWGGVPGYAGQQARCDAGFAPGGSQAEPCFQPMWYVGAAGLIMSRDKANGVWTTYESGASANRLMRTTDAEVDWRGGYEVRLGRYFASGRWALEGVYWSIDGFQGFASSSVAGGTVSTPLIVSDIEFAGTSGTAYFDEAEEHRLWRRNEFENIEINLTRHRVDPYGASLVDLHWLLGVRYFRFEESLRFGSLAAGGTWGGTDPDEAYLSDRVNNNLIGVQIGLETGCQLGYKLRVFLAPKVGLYNNHIENRFDAYRGDGVLASPTAASGFAGTYPVVATTDAFAFLAEIDAGVDWQFHPRWNAFAGYRLVAATGIALADHQIPTYVADIGNELALIDHNGHLILHGAVAGLQFRF